MKIRTATATRASASIRADHRRQPAASFSTLPTALAASSAPPPPAAVNNH